MSRSYPALERYYPEDPESPGVHACNGPHIPCKSRNVNQILGMSECMSIQRSQDAIYRPYEWHILKKSEGSKTYRTISVNDWGEDCCYCCFCLATLSPQISVS